MWFDEKKVEYIFGVSIRGLTWKYDDNDSLVDSLAFEASISKTLARILINRGITTLSDAESFLNPLLKDLMPNPFKLKDMDKAAKRIVQAILQNQKITVFGDYDVDGATSTALLHRFFSDLGVQVEIYIPSRMHEGYGPSVEAFKKIIESGADLIITVDCGVVSFDALEYAHAQGFDVIVLDHHLSIDRLPPAVAIVNPNRFDETFEFKSFAAVAIAFLTTVAVRAELRETGFFANHASEVDLMKLLDLVALGTVCDVMALKDINRAFVKHGLYLLAKRNNIGLTTLAKIAKVEDTPQSYHLGFILGPRINAGGRVGEGILGSRLLHTDDPEIALEIAMRLEELNNERKAIEGAILEEALNLISNKGLHEKHIIMVAGNEWHQGVLGILASRIKERFGRPAIVVSIEKGVAKGSARSISGIDLGAMFAEAKKLGLIEQGGGHAMAGGFVANASMLEDFYSFLLQKTLNSNEHLEKTKHIIVDAAIDITAVTPKLIHDINLAAPFGQGNPVPRFVLRNVVIVNIKSIAKIHLMMIVKDAVIKNGMTIKCMLFRAANTKLGDTLASAVGRKVNLLGTLQISMRDNSQADFIIEDASFIE